MRETEFRALVAEEFRSIIKDPRVERTRKYPLETPPFGRSCSATRKIG